jgi:hypothetical protein
LIRLVECAVEVDVPSKKKRSYRYDGNACSHAQPCQNHRAGFEAEEEAKLIHSRKFHFVNVVSSEVETKIKLLSMFINIFDRTFILSFKSHNR